MPRPPLAALDRPPRKIAVIGAGIVGVPMAALLADAGPEQEHDPFEVVLLQRASATSGWKVDAVNRGESPIGGREPELGEIVRRTVAAGRLRAAHDYAEARDADAVLVCVQTDKRGIEPDYGPLFDALDALAGVLTTRPAELGPVLVVLESTLAPSSMATVVRERFIRGGLREGRDLLLANSPNRVMPGRLVERVRTADKLVGGLTAGAAQRVERLYRRVVRRGRLHLTSSLTAEIVKTLENAYRDVRIAFSAETARACDAADIDFFALRDAVNARLARSDGASADPRAVPTGGMLIPMVGVGGHCLPKDGVLLWWRRLASGDSGATSLILAARRINDAAPADLLRRIETRFGPVRGHRLALLGAAYRADSEDTRNSPTLALAELLRAAGAVVAIHDPFVRPGDQNMVTRGFADALTSDLDRALDGAELAVCCVAHGTYAGIAPRLADRVSGIVDGCNLMRPADAAREGLDYLGIGRGMRTAEPALVTAVYDAFRAVERGVANEVASLAEFLTARYADSLADAAGIDEIRRLAATCTTGCEIVAPGPVDPVPRHPAFSSELAELAADAWRSEPRTRHSAPLAVPEPAS